MHTPSTIALAKLIGIPTTRNLTPDEIKLLRTSKQEIQQMRRVKSTDANQNF